MDKPVFASIPATALVYGKDNLEHGGPLRNRYRSAAWATIERSNDLLYFVTHE
jgi:hypothetical protein